MYIAVEVSLQSFQQYTRQQIVQGYRLLILNSMFLRPLQIYLNLEIYNISNVV